MSAERHTDVSYRNIYVNMNTLAASRSYSLCVRRFDT